MALKQEHALLVGIATAGVVYGIYQIHMPSVAGVRASKPDNTHIDASRKSATILSASIVALLGLLSADPTVFIIGGISVIGLDMTHRTANAVDNVSGKLPAPSSTGAAASAAGTIQVSGGGY